MLYWLIIIDIEIKIMDIKNKLNATLNFKYIFYYLLILIYLYYTRKINLFYKSTLAYFLSSLYTLPRLNNSPPDIQ